MEDIESMLVQELVSDLSPPSEFIAYANRAIEEIEEDLLSIDSGSVTIRNKQRKRKRLLMKKEKMKVRIQFAYRDLQNQDLSPSEKRTLTYFSKKLSRQEEGMEESDGDFLSRVLCLELNLTFEDWFEN